MKKNFLIIFAIVCMAGIISARAAIPFIYDYNDPNAERRPLPGMPPNFPDLPPYNPGPRNPIFTIKFR